jgi:hypothetical protein
MFIVSATQISVRNLLLEIRFTKPEFVGWTHRSRTCATIPLVCWSSKLRAEGCVVEFTHCDFQRPWADTSHYLNLSLQLAASSIKSISKKFGKFSIFGLLWEYTASQIRICVQMVLPVPIQEVQEVIHN